MFLMLYSLGHHETALRQVDVVWLSPAPVAAAAVRPTGVGVAGAVGGAGGLKTRHVPLILNISKSNW